MAKRRLSDKEFWTILRANAGLYARTARAIEKEFGITYSRQSVRDRAEKKPELLQDILEENLDLAEEGHISLMRSKNEKIRLNAITFYLRTKGKARGYVTQVDSDITSKGEKIEAPTLMVMSAATMTPEEIEAYKKKFLDVHSTDND